MALKRYKPVTNGLRHRVSVDVKDLSNAEPEKSLIKGTKKGKGNGRNNQGVITVRHRGGGHKKLYREIDFKRSVRGVKGKVVSIEYDPYRTARIALIHYTNGEKRYILAPVGLKVGSFIEAGEKAEIEIGNAMPLSSVPVGTVIHNIELKPGAGGQLVRSAGNYAKLEGKENKYAMIRLPSGEIRMVLQRCWATIGEVGNMDHLNISLGKAGNARHLGDRPHVRGVAMNKHDHPHGGGRGKQKGYKTPTSPTGVPAKGYKTRKANKYSDRMIIAKRKK